MSVGKPQKRHLFIPSPSEVDEAVLGLFESLTHDLGRPYRPSRKNIRRVTSVWDPLRIGFSPLDRVSFANSYMPAHFFDRYLFSDDDPKELEKLAFKKFKGVNEEGVYFNSKLAPGNKLEPTLNSVLCEAALVCQRILGDFDYLEIFEACNHGPGASIGVPYHRAQLDSKVLSLVMTPACYTVFLEYLKWDTTTSSALRSYLPRGEPDRFVAGNRLSFVPKKFDSLRTMQVEPTVNQFFQLGTGYVIADRLRGRNGAGIDLETQQECHRQLALWSSKFGVLGTIDWSQASDRIWMNLVQRIVPASWFYWFKLIRSPCTTYKKKDISLEMIGTMGNGFSFPLQTLVYYCLLVGLARTFNKSEFISVFGDDCIIDADMLPQAEWLAKEIGFILNESKSFTTGGFRESCGMDAWRGMGVRPFMVERPLCTNPPFLKAWLYTCFNGLQDRYKHVSLSSCFEWLITYHSKWQLGKVLVVPDRFATTAGVHCPTPERLHVSTPPMTVDVHGGVSFRALQVKPMRVVVDQRPYYIWSLAGRGIPVLQFGKAGIGVDDIQDLMPDVTGHVPGKTYTYVEKQVSVHTWKYLT